MIVARLTCEHRIRILRFRDKVSLEEYCNDCQEWRLVMDFTKDKWHSRCQDCKHSRSHGQSELLANRAADEHAKLKPSHRPYISYYNEWDKQSDIPLSYPSAPSLFDAPDEPPPF